MKLTEAIRTLRSQAEEVHKIMCELEEGRGNDKILRDLGTAFQSTYDAADRLVNRFAAQGDKEVRRC